MSPFLLALATAGLQLVSSEEVASPAGPEKTCPDGRALPEFPHPDAGDWINSAPRARADLAGRPALLFVWTFG